MGRGVTAEGKGDQGTAVCAVVACAWAGREGRQMRAVADHRFVYRLLVTALNDKCTEVVRPSGVPVP